MNSEMRARIFVTLLFFCLGMTLGWLTGGAGMIQWAILIADVLFLVAICRFIYKIYMGVKTGKFAEKGKHTT